MGFNQEEVNPMMSTRRKRIKEGTSNKGASGKAPSRASNRVKSALSSGKEGKRSLVLRRAVSRGEKTDQKTIFSLPDLVRDIGATIREPLLVLDPDLRVLSANRSFYKTFQIKPEETEGKLFYRIGNRQWDIPELRQKLNQVLHKQTSFEDLELKQKLPRMGERTILVNARVISGQGEKPEFVLLAIRDVTESREAKESNERFSSFPTVNPMPIVETDITGRVLYMNPAAKRLFPELSNMGGKHPFLAELSSAVNELKSGRREWVRRQVEFEGAWYGQTIYKVEDGLRIRVYSADITEAIRIRQALQASERKFKKIYEQSPIGIELYDQEGRLLDANHACLDIFGVSDITEVKGLKLFEDPNLSLEAKEKLLKGKTIRYEGPFDFEKVKEQKLYKTKKSGMVYLDVAITPLSAVGEKSQRGYLVQVQDITERKRMEEALRGSETKYRIVADNTYDWEFWSNPEGEYLYISPSCKRITGHDPEEFLKDPDLCHRIIHPDDRSCFDDHLRKVEGRKAGEVEFRIIRPDGAIRWIHHACQSVYDSDRNYLGPRGNNRDITERKHKEEELRQLNRVLKAHSDSNQAMMHATSESGYLKEVCDFIIKDCGYLMVWIGFGENDENKTVRPAAQAGFEKGYLETANITWSDSERGHGPTGTAIRTGKPAICRNMLTDPDFKPWRKEALKRGYASSIVLPLTFDGKTFGAINIYSKEPNPFSEEEIKLLTELSNDLAYGIMTLRLRLEREQAEAALAKSEEKYRFLYEEGQSLNIIIGPDQTIKDTNKTAMNLLGYEKDEVVGKPVLEFIPDEEKERVKGILAETFAGGTNQEYEIPVLAKNDSVHLILFSPGQVTLMEREAVTGIVVTGIDITERKQVEEALQKSEERLNRAEEIAHVGSWELDLINNHLSWSDEVYRIFGLKPQEFGATYEAFLEAVHPDDRKAVDATYRGSIREGRDSYEIEHRVVRKSTGEVRVVHEKCAHIRDESGQIIRSTGMVHDITERKKAEEVLKKVTAELKEERDLLNVIKENTNTNLAYLDTHFNLIRVNSAFVRTFGHSEEEFIGKNLLNLLQGKEYEAMFEKARDTGETVEYKAKPLKFKDQHEKEITYCDLTLIPVKDNLDHVQGLEFSLVDVTEIKLAEEKIKALNEILKHQAADLAASNKELEAFSYSVSHDLRAPVRKIEGFSRALLEDYAEAIDEQGQDYLKRLRGAADKMKQLIEDLLNLSRLTRAEMKREETDLSALAQTIAGDLQKSQPQRKVEFKIDKKLVAKVDRRLLEIALENLLGNAWKFTSTQTEARIEFTATEKNGEMVYLVRDNGVGFDMTYANRLFIPFQRLHSTDEFPGTGIGLATVKRIINRHGGRIWAEGEEEKGANFFFTLGYKNTPETNRV
jgi:PAS domain S-box-containing protein